MSHAVDRFDPAVLDTYRLANPTAIRTPALAIYPRHVDANIDATLGLLDGDRNRWRPHVKTAKLAFTVGRYLDRGVRNFKCATTLELNMLCEAGVDDALLAYPVVSANARRVSELARTHPGIRVSALVEHPDQLAFWRDACVGLFIDVNPGMDRTGVSDADPAAVLELARAIVDAGLEFRGIHDYEGQLTVADLAKRRRQAAPGYSALVTLVEAFDRAGTPVGEVVTSGTPGMQTALGHRALREMKPLHRVSPGTVVYNDVTSLAQLPIDAGYRPAALVLASVVSHPAPGTFTCDAGHKTVPADCGVPTCDVLGRPGLRPGKPSEEHLPVEVRGKGLLPALGEMLYLLPAHICPAINNFDHALIVEDGEVKGVERVTARGREIPVDLSLNWGQQP